MSENDPELDAKWREASREQPPAALDDAIRAAARREVGARRGAFRATPRWLPLAAAATVAAIAVGIVQMTPPEQVTAPAGQAAPAKASSSLDSAQRNAARDADEARANMAQRSPPDGPASAVAPAIAPQARPEAAKPRSKEQSRPSRESASETDRDVLSRNRSDTLAAPAAQSEEKKKLAERQAAPQPAAEAVEREQSLQRKSEPGAAREGGSPASQVASNSSAAGRQNGLRPFPATPPPTESVAGNAPPSTVAQAPAPMVAPAPSPAPAIEARKLAAPSRATGALSGSVDAKDAANADPFPSRDAAALGKTATADKLLPELKKDATPLAPAEWIKRIRRLIAEGRTDEAAKELFAFRREYKERSETLLPSDLRSFTP